MLRLFTLDTRIFLSFFFSLRFFLRLLPSLYLPLDIRYRWFSWEIGVSLFDVTRSEVKVTSKIDGSVYVHTMCVQYRAKVFRIINLFMDVQIYRILSNNFVVYWFEIVATNSFMVNEFFRKVISIFWSNIAGIIHWFINLLIRLKIEISSFNRS